MFISSVYFKLNTNIFKNSSKNVFFHCLFHIFILFIFTLMFSFNYTYAAFEDLGIGARATGMSNAFTAVADDAYAIYYNPAGLANLQSPEFASTYGKLLIGLDDKSNLGNSFVVYSHPLIKRYKNGQTYQLGTISIAWQELRLDSLYRENVFYLSYARMIRERVRAGINIKRLRCGFGSNDYTENAIDQEGNARGTKDPVFNGGSSSSAFAVDLGFQYALKHNERIVLGLSLLNINQPNIALRGTDKVPFTKKFGILYRHDIANFSMDLIRRKSLRSTTDTIINTAGEKWIDFKSFGIVGIRGGLGIGSRSYRSVSVGASYGINAIQFDYGFVLPLTGIEDTMGSHRVSLSFRFGEESSKDYIDKLLFEEEGLYQEAEEALKQAKRELELARKEAELARQEVELTQQKMHLKKSEQALKRAKKAEYKAKNIYERACTIAYKFYKKRVANNISLKEQIIVLEKIIAKYKSTGISVRNLEYELKSVKRKIKIAEKDYKMEMEYYRKMKRGGANEEDSRMILNRILNRYRVLGIDVTSCEQELENLGIK